VEITEAGARRAVDEFLAARAADGLYCFNNTLARLAIDELKRRD
jgi:DNA-binding LacI/PurR family transcriptional regulator